MRSPTAGSVVLTLLLLFVAVGAASGVAQDDPPAETLHLELESGGDAHWTVTVRFDLESPDDRDGFDRVAAEFEAGESDILSVDPYRAAAEQASDATGRPMEIEDVSRRAARENDTGRLELAFRWTAFARQSGDRLLLGDVFSADTERGTWLPGLEAEQALIIDFPDEFSVVNSSHKLERRAFEIRGPTTFDAGTPSATLVRDQVTTTDPLTTDPPRTNTTSEPPAGGEWDVIGVGALAVLLGTLAILVERRRRTGDAVPADGDGGRSGDVGVTDGANADGGATLDPDPEDAANEPLLSDDERVLRLLHQNDGRMKQGQIVEETGWSNAKVSQLLSEMAEGGQVNKLRIGRENLISLPGQGPDDE